MYVEADIKAFYITFSSWLNPCGVSVCNLIIQKFSLSLSIRDFSAYERLLFLICSMNVNLAWVLKSWPGSRKCASTGIELDLFASLQWLFILSFPAV